MSGPIPHAAVTRGTDRVRCAPLACELSAKACAARHVARQSTGHRNGRDPRAFAEHAVCARCADGQVAHARLGGRGTPGRVALLVLPDAGHPL